MRPIRLIRRESELDVLARAAAEFNIPLKVEAHGGEEFIMLYPGIQFEHKVAVTLKAGEIGIMIDNNGRDLSPYWKRVDELRETANASAPHVSTLT